MCWECLNLWAWAGACCGLRSGINCLGDVSAFPMAIETPTWTQLQKEMIRQDGTQYHRQNKEKFAVMAQEPRLDHINNREMEHIRREQAHSALNWIPSFSKSESLHTSLSYWKQLLCHIFSWASCIESLTKPKFCVWFLLSASMTVVALYSAASKWYIFYDQSEILWIKNSLFHDSPRFYLHTYEQSMPSAYIYFSIDKWGWADLVGWTPNLQSLTGMVAVPINWTA